MHKRNRKTPYASRVGTLPIVSHLKTEMLDQKAAANLVPQGSNWDSSPWKANDWKLDLEVFPRSSFHHKPTPSPEHFNQWAWVVTSFSSFVWCHDVGTSHLYVTLDALYWGIFISTILYRGEGFILSVNLCGFRSATWRLEFTQMYKWCINSVDSHFTLKWGHLDKYFVFEGWGIKQCTF